MRTAYLLILLSTIALVCSAQLEPLEIPRAATEVLPAAPLSPPQVPPQLPAPQARLAYSLVIENRTNGAIRIVEPPAQYLLNRPGQHIGTVLHPAGRLAEGDSTLRSSRGWPHVAVSATDSVSLTLDTSRPGQPTAGIDLLPVERNFQAPDGSFEHPLSTAVYTDIPRGRGIFGGAFALLPGNPVSIIRDGRLIGFDAANRELHPGDIVVVEVYGPEQWPLHLDIANRAAGEARLTLADGTEIICATMVQPFNGKQLEPANVAGALPGSLFRAGTTGLCIACPPAENIRQLELLPNGAAGASSASNSTDTPPWALLTGVSGSVAGGQPPLFDGYCYPCGVEPHTALPALSISVQLEGFGTWQPLSSLIVPEAAGKIAVLRLAWEPLAEVDTAAPDSGLDPAVPVIPPDGAPSLRR